VFKNVVAQFIGQMRLMNQATTEIWGWNISNMPKNERKIKIKQPPPLMGGEACPERSEGTKVRVKSPSL